MIGGMLESIIIFLILVKEQQETIRLHVPSINIYMHANICNKLLKNAQIFHDVSSQQVKLDLTEFGNERIFYNS